MTTSRTGAVIQIIIRISEITEVILIIIITIIMTITVDLKTNIITIIITIVTTIIIIIGDRITTVSYTHLDVYKRQIMTSSKRNSARSIGRRPHKT